TATTEIYTLSLHDALPISPAAAVRPESAGRRPGPSQASRLDQQLGHQLGRQAVRLVQVPEVRLGQRAAGAGAEPRQHLAAPAHQPREPLLLTADHVADRPAAPVLPEPPERVLEQ